MQRILLCLFCFYPIYGAKFQGFVSIAIVDTFTGRTENILLEPQKILKDDLNLFEIKVKNIESDEENPSIAWVDIEIRYKPSKNDTLICAQLGKLCSNQIYRFRGGRYIIGFDISYYTDDDSHLKTTKGNT